jgi:hypothetical protein
VTMKGFIASGPDDGTLFGAYVRQAAICSFACAVSVDLDLERAALVALSCTAASALIALACLVSAVRRS